MSKSKSNENKSQSEVISLDPVVKKGFLRRIYDFSIYRFRVFSLLLIVVGVYFVAAGTLNLLNVVFYSKSTQGNSLEENMADKTETSPSETDHLIGTGISTTIEKETEKASEIVSEVKTTADLARKDSLDKTEELGVWVATNYSEGDITRGSYTVARGDTLWEIAEAVYGSGTMWRQILSANSDSVGFLPNGSQALIVPGQTLVIP